MLCLGIDPSYSNSGLGILDGENLVHGFSSLSVPKVLRKPKLTAIDVSMRAAEWMSNEVHSFMLDNPVDMIVSEYPVLGTFSGAYLGLLAQSLYLIYPRDIPVYLVPAQAIDSTVGVSRMKFEGTADSKKKAKKAAIVSWVKREFEFEEEDPSLDHDMASALVLARIGHLISKGVYKNSFIRLNFL